MKQRKWKAHRVRRKRDARREADGSGMASRAEMFINDITTRVGEVGYPDGGRFQDLDSNKVDWEFIRI
jgi:hypothetical protein